MYVSGDFLLIVDLTAVNYIIILQILIYLFYEF